MSARGTSKYTKEDVRQRFRGMQLRAKGLRDEEDLTWREAQKRAGEEFRGGKPQKPRRSEYVQRIYDEGDKERGTEEGKERLKDYREGKRRIREVKQDMRERGLLPRLTGKVQRGVRVKDMTREQRAEYRARIAAAREAKLRAYKANPEKYLNEQAKAKAKWEKSHLREGLARSAEQIRRNLKGPRDADNTRRGGGGPAPMETTEGFY